MYSFRFALVRICSLGAVLVSPLVHDGSDQAYAASPFHAIGGSWHGSGRIRLSDGKTENLRCRAYYNPKSGRAHLGMAIRCASASYNIHMRSSLNFDGGRVTGSWEERTFNASGGVSGSARNGSISLSVSGAVSGRMNISYGGSRQNVSITTSGTALESVNISLRR